ncbi:FHA domain-containing protein [Mycolicibacterium peregrinum]|uniref:FHA domain-containing protein n=1 Tax=Mycolicibacterium peregrinum TaxID=43304 RepID=A0A1A0V7Z1_MYCPR|nr:FHA domain-containing protein [Mycolicibacterium peregrinum]OBB79306.1 hypothetical protein A5779_13005 [Mycolicibacterium peregrinum]
MASAEVMVQRGARVPALTVKWPDHLAPFNGDQSPVVVGRAENVDAQVRIQDNRISREHIVATVGEGHWIIQSPGRNGVFIGNERLAHDFVLPPDHDIDVMLGHPTAGIPMSLSTRDPANVFIGELIARRRKELALTQRFLAEDGVVNAGALISVEKGRSQPRAKTERSLETVLQWPEGHIEQLRRRVRQQLRMGTFGEQVTSAPVAELAPVASAVPASEEPTQWLRMDRDGEGTATVEVTLVSETVGIAMDSIRNQIAALPDSTHRDYPARVEKITEGLARLEPVMVSASGTSVEMVRDLGEIRRLRRNLMLKAAESPHATLGQRVFAARRNAELSIAEAAVTAGVSAEEVRQAEAGSVQDERVWDALQRFIAALGNDTGKRTAG